MLLTPAHLPAELGRFTLLDQIGEGGMAQVFRAAMRGEGGFAKVVAIKLVRPELAAADPEFVKQLISEARLGGYVHHPGIVETYAFGQERGRHFIAMEYVDGPTLHRLLYLSAHLGIAIPTSVSLRLVAEAADALHTAHGARDLDGNPLHLVHRDIKPSNILLTRSGQVKVADFGVARARSNLSQTVHTGVIKGTLRFMSPEQAWGDRTIDHRSDIFSLGALLFEMLTSQRLYAGKAAERLLRDAQDANYADLSAILPGHPLREPLIELLSKALAPERDARFQSARALRAAALRAHDQLADKVGIRAWVDEVLTISEAAAPTQQVSAERVRQMLEDAPHEGGGAIELADASSGSNQEGRWEELLPDAGTMSAQGLSTGGIDLATAPPPVKTPPPPPHERSRAALYGVVAAVLACGLGLGLWAVGLAGGDAPPAAPAAHGPQQALEQVDAELPPPTAPPGEGLASGAVTPAPEATRPPATSPPKANKRLAARPKAKAKPASTQPPGRLHMGMPFGATVKVDGNPVGKTPLRGVVVRSGKRHVTVVRADGSQVSRVVNVPAGGDLHCRATGGVQCE